MIRFIVRRKRKDDPFSAGYESLETFIADVPILQEALLRGGTSQDGYDLTELVGVEVVTSVGGGGK